MLPLIIHFINLLRREGLHAGIQETIDVLEAAGSGTLESRYRFKVAMRSLCCSSLEETHIFNRLFELYWDEKNESPAKSFRKIINPMQLVNNKKASVVMLGSGKQEGEQQDAKNTSGANAAERLRHTDFTKVAEVETDLLEQIARRLCKEMSHRIRRRLKSNGARRQIDLRKTFRRNIEKGGTPLQLLYKGRRIQKDKLILFLDVSGSMDKYSFFLLRFIFTLREHFRKLEVFVFSTGLMRVSPLIQSKGIDKALQLLSGQAHFWSGGTKIGECLGTFNTTYSRYLSKSNSVVIMVSDGLDTGASELLQTELQKIKRRSKKIIWLNPLKGMKDYAPIAKGMSTALPLVDEFGSAHNLDSIIELEKYLMNA